MGSAAGQTNGAVAGTVEVAAAAAAADHYMGGTAAMVVAEADLGWGPDFLGSSEDSYFEIGSAVTSASESRQAHWRHSEIAGAAEKIEKNIWKDPLSSFPEVQQLLLPGIDLVVDLAQKHQALAASRV